MKKQRLSVYVEPDAMQELIAFAARTGRSRSLVAEAAIASFLSPDAMGQREAAIAKRLDRIDRRLDRLERDQDIALETVALFVRFWLAATPALPDAGQPASRAKAGERFDTFVAALGRRLASGRRLSREVLADIAGD